VYALSVDRKSAEPLLRTSFLELNPRLSVDGRWLAYVSNESGQNEVYVRPFVVDTDGKPSLGAKWRASTSGGGAPRWRSDGKELVYRDATGAFMAVDVRVAGASLETGLPRRLFSPAPSVHAWDMTADGQRFLIATPLRTTAVPQADPITVVLNWKSALAK